MINTLFQKWQEKIAQSPHTDALTLFQKKDLLIKLIQVLFSPKKEIYYTLPEIINLTESNCLDYRAFTNALFLLRDTLIYHSRNLSISSSELHQALDTLEEIILKVGAYFSHLRADLNSSYYRNIHSINAESIKGNIIHLDEEFRIEKTNSALLNNFGYEKQEVLGKPLHILFSESSKTIIQNALIQLKKNLRFQLDLEVEASKKNGQRFQALLKISRINIYGVPPKFIAYIKDNTYIHETKSMLNLLSMALESVGEGIIILEPNEQGNILYVNAAMEKMSGFARHQLLGRPFKILRDSSATDELEKDIIKVSLSKGWKGEITNRHKNNHIYLVNLHTQPVKDEYGNVVAIVGIERDITKQKAREDQIIHLKQFVERIINNLPHFVIVTDMSLNIQFWNQFLENESKLKAESVIGKSIFEVFPSLTRLHFDIAAKNTIKTGEFFSKKFYADLFNNGDRYYQLILTPISTDQGIQLLWTILDITKEEILKIRITWQNARLKFLENFSQILNTSLDLRTIFQKLTNELRKILPHKTLSFLIPYNIEKLQFNLFFFSADGIDSFPENYAIDLSEDTSYQELIQKKEPQVHNYYSLEDKLQQFEEEPEYTENIHQLIRIPVCFEKEILGILNIGHEEANYFKQMDIDFLQQIASHLAIAIKNSSYFNLIELQNKKLNIINNILNFPQISSSIDKIYNEAANGFSEILKSELILLYNSRDGNNWNLIVATGNYEHIPATFCLSLDSLKKKSIFWNRFNPFSPDINDFIEFKNYPSGLFIWEISSSHGYFGLWALNNRILDQIEATFILSLVQDIFKQMMIAIDHIDLFEKVKQAESEWKITFDSVNIGLAAIDKDFRILRANKTFLKLYDVNIQQIIGKNFIELFGEYLNFDSNDFSQIHKKKLTEFREEYYDRRINKKLALKFYPHFDAAEDFQGGVFTLQDVTKQREQEAQIRFLSKFPETNPNIVICTDMNGQIKYINPTARRFMQEFNLSEENLQDLLPGNIQMIIENFNKQKVSHLELEYKFKDRVFEYFIYRTMDGNQFYFYGIDITDKVELHRQLLQTENIRAVGEMAAGVAHDFNNLLATILGRTQLLLLKNYDQKIKDELKVIEKAALDGSEIVRRLQEATREKRDENFQTVDLTEIIRESIIFSASKLKINNQLKGKHIKMHTDLQDNVLVKGNRVELKEVFTNILLNAYDAMIDGGDLFVKCKNDDNLAHIVIRDTGIGMSEEVKNKIFNPFFTTKGERGTGLGLSIVYRTITSYGGHIKVESEINKGTTFTITLPLSDEPVDSEQKKKIEIEVNNGNLKLLIVDDEPELLYTMAEILRLKFKSVDIADSGKSALAKIEKQTFDVILTDLGMPEMSGWELAQQIKNIQPNSRVILVTGWGDQAKEELKHHPYVDEILSKPYELQNLIEKINKFSQS